MTERIAKCSCGQLSIATQEKPEIVAICNCHQCQARTGSVFAVNAFFPHATSRIKGESKIYERRADSGRTVRCHFCPICGGTIYWQSEIRPQSWGVAVGAFQDPTFPPPVGAVWMEKKLGWVRVPDGIPTFPQGVPQSPPSRT